MVSKVRGGWRRLGGRVGAALAATALASCGPVQTTSAERFRESGELIAWSGGNAGAANACFTCHGVDGRGNGAGAPRLAGLGIGYLDRQLEAYDDGRRRHPQMAWISRRLTASDRRAVSAYYADLPWAATPATTAAQPPPALWVDGDPARGLPACASCHGRDGEGEGSAAPPLAGQPAAYQAQQLDSWRRSERRTDPGHVMLRISQRLTPREAAALSAYAAALAGSLPASARPEPRAASPEERRSAPRSGASAPPPHAAARAGATR